MLSFLLQDYSFATFHLFSLCDMPTSLRRVVTRGHKTMCFQLNSLEVQAKRNSS